MSQPGPDPFGDDRETVKERKPFVSIVMPAFNEGNILEKSLEQLCDYMMSLEDQYGWELIIINDGSTDETGDVAEVWASRRENISVLHHMHNFRLGQALRYAFTMCRGDYVVVLDADLSYSPDHIERLLSKIRETRAKIVVASPYREGGSVANVPWLRKVLSVWANRYLCLTATRDSFSDKLTTITGMVRAYDRAFLSGLNLKAMDVDINPEIIYKAMILRARIVEIPAHLDWRPEKAGKAGKPVRRSSMRIARSILRSLLAGFVFRPFMFFVLPGVALILMSLYPIFWTLVHSVTHFQALADADLSFDYRLSDAIGAAFSQSPHAFVVGGFGLMIGIQLLSLGLLALQKKYYFEELFHLGSAIHRDTQRQVPDIQDPAP